MLKTKMAPDPLRDAPEGHGDHQAPGERTMLPSRAIVDSRFNRFPMSLRTLALCCGHASGRNAQFYVNQSTMSVIMECSQQSVSKHMRNLVRFGYLEKIRKEDPRKTWGSQGALWRVIFNPSMSNEDCLNSAPVTEEQEHIRAEETIKLAAVGPKGHTNKPVDNSVNNPSSYNLGVVTPYNLEVVHNTSIKEVRKNINEDECKRMCNDYGQLIVEVHGQPWRYDIRQLLLARTILERMSSTEFLADAKATLTWMKKANREPAQSLQYFISKYTKVAKPKDHRAILAQVTARMNMRR